ncbi:hypothetical protein [Streptomyces sp. NPDC059063]|uniref:hypothetical protein n=1 Tax=unclassified Streptomyces TaxID=2593676 RepID=UPI0036BD4D9B
MWRDEAVTYDMAHRDLSGLWRTLGTADAVHGLYYLVMHGLFAVCSLFGSVDPLLVLRLPSVVAMAVAAAGVACVGRRLSGARAGLFAGTVFALLPPVQHFAQEGRSYAMVCALVVWATYLLARAGAGPCRGSWTGYAALMLAACLLHEFAVLGLVAHGVAVGRGVRRAWAARAAAVGAVVAPLAVFSQRQSAQVDWIGTDVGAYGGALLMCAGGLACAVFLVHGDVASPPPASGEPVSAQPVRLPRLALALLCVPTLALLLISAVKPLYVDRYVLYCVAGLALLVGAALDLVARGGRWGPAAAGALAAVALGAHLPAMTELRTPPSRVDDATAAARALHEAGRTGDAVVYMPLRRRVWTLPYPWAADGLRDVALARGPAASHTLYGTEVRPDVLRARMRARTRIVAVADPAGAPVDASPQEAVKRDVLARYFVPCRTAYAKGARITLHARPGHC